MKKTLQGKERETRRSEININAQVRSIYNAGYVQ